MTQQTSPFIEGKFGWALGESNWNLGMDENLLKFSYLFDRNIDGIVSSLPAPVNGEAYFNTTDNRIYYAVNGVFSSTPVPKWFEITLRTSGDNYVFNGSALVLSNFVTEADLAATTGADLVGYMGRTQAEKNADFISVKDYGAIGDGTYHPLSEEYGSLAAAQLVYPFVTNLSQSLDWAGIQAAVNTGKQAYAPSGKYYVTDTIVAVRGGGLFGDGVDRWDAIFNSDTSFQGNFKKEDSRGTHLYMYGAGAKTYSQERTSGCLVSGGARTINSLPFDILDFRNKDGVSGNPSTKKMYSVGFKMASFFNLSDLRIIPSFNGIEGYRDNVTLSLADDWDVGIDTTGAWGYTVTGVQTIGYWRMAGALVSGAQSTDEHGNAERGYWSKCLFQGIRGLALRSMDSAKVVAFTATSITVPYDPSFIWNAYSNFRIQGTNIGAVYSYGSWTFNAGPNTVTFNDISPAMPVGSVPLDIRAAIGSNGFAFSNFSNCYASGLDHASGNRADQLGLGVSSPIEISGAGIRQPQFYAFKFQTHESCAGMFHNNLNVRMQDCQFEGRNDTTTFLVASPFDSGPDITTPFQRGQTDDFLLEGGSLISPSVNTTYFTPRNGIYQRGVFVTEGVVGASVDKPFMMKNWRKGSLELQNDLGVPLLSLSSSDDPEQCTSLLGTSYTLIPNSTDLNLRILGSRNFSVRSNAGVTNFKVLQSGRVEIINALQSATDGATSLGVTTLRFNDTFSRQYTIGLGSVRQLSGTGTPEGAVTAVVGSTFQRSDGGALTSFYVKETGSGNTGWVAK